MKRVQSELFIAIECKVLFETFRCENAMKMNTKTAALSMGST